jgi:hypothetical protein
MPKSINGTFIGIRMKPRAKKLRCVHAFAAGQEFAALSKELRIHEQSSRSYINIYIREGFAGLCTAIKRPRSGQLTAEQEQAFKQVLLTSRPADVGLEGNIWTGTVR